MQFLFFVLQLIEPVIDSPLHEQFLMRPLLAQTAFVKYQNAIGVLDGAQAMRYDQRGSAGKQTIQRLADQHFCFGVHAGSGFVKRRRGQLMS